MEGCDAEEARVETEGVREKVWPPREDMECSESLDMREVERLRARASKELCLVWEGERLGMAGALGSRVAVDCC